MFSGRSEGVSAVDKREYLTDEELVRLAVGGDRMAEEDLVRRYRGLVFDRARPYFLPGAEQEDMIQEGMIGLCQAIYAFDEEKGAAFLPFASVCVTRQIISAVKRHGRQKHAPLNGCLSLYAPVGEEDGEMFLAALADGAAPDLEDALIGRERLTHLERKMDEHLTCQERRMFRLYAEGASYQMIARYLGKSVKSVDNTIQRVRRKLRQLLCEDGWLELA